MLVLTRKFNQKIQIGNDVVVTILHIKGQTVRVGIEAPRQVRVMRSELMPPAVDSGVDSQTDVVTSRDGMVPQPSTVGDWVAPQDNDLRDHAISTATTATPVVNRPTTRIMHTGQTSPQSSWDDRLADKSFSRPDRTSVGGNRLAALVAARRGV